MIVNKQITVGTINEDRLTFNTIRRLSTTSLVDFTSPAISTLFTVPANRIAIILGLMIELVAVSGVTVDSQVSLGLNGSADDIFSLETVTNLRVNDDIWTNWLILSKSEAAIAGKTIKLNIQTGATSTVLLADVHLIGFLI